MQVITIKSHAERKPIKIVHPIFMQLVIRKKSHLE